jgi:predicted HTH domain antitoxin
MKLYLPDEIIQPLNLTEDDLRLELAIALYAAKKISFGKARKLANTDWYTFRQILDSRDIPAHYNVEDFEQDLETLSNFPKG